MTKTMKLRVQAAEMGFLRRVAGVSLRDRLRSSAIQGRDSSLRGEEPVEVVWASNEDATRVPS